MQDGSTDIASTSSERRLRTRWRRSSIVKGISPTSPEQRRVSGRYSRSSSDSVTLSDQAAMKLSASRFAAVWAFGYALYRSYYALGGTFGMFGTPVSLEQFRRINAIAAVMLFVTALLPLAFVNTWDN